MPTREEKIAFLKAKMGGASAQTPSVNQNPSSVSRQQKIAFIQQKMSEPESQPEGYGKQLLRGALDALPIAGGVGGALVGGAPGLITGPGALATGAVGAGLGYGMGSELRDLGKQYLLGEQPTANITNEPVEVVKRIGGNLLEGASQEMAGQIIGKGIGAAAQSKPGRYVINKTGKIASKIASTLSGVPEKEIQIYANHADEINQMAKSTDNDAQEMADQLRQKLNSKIQQTKSSVNDSIEKILSSKGADKRLSVEPIINELESAKMSLDPDLHAKDIAEITDIQNLIKQQAKNRGAEAGIENSDSLGAIDLHRLKRYLQDLASGSYSKEGKIFQVGTEAGRAAKGAARIARLETEKLAPGVAEANAKLARLHSIEETITPNILKEGKSGAALFSAGSGGNPANAKALKQLGSEVGMDALGEAEKISTARTFGKPSLLPVDTTGKSLTRMGVSGVAGYLIGGVPGAVMAEGLSSPAAIKAGINLGKSSKDIVAQAFKKAPAAIGAIVTNIYKKSNVDDLKGKDRWALNGYSKIVDHNQAFSDPNTAKRLFSTKEGKELLIKASDLKPGSKAMDDIANKLNKLSAGGGK